MLLVNKFNSTIDGFDYVNGSMGIIVDYDPEIPTITIRLDNGSEVTVKEHFWSNYEYVLDDNFEDGRIEQKKTGTFKQLPIIPAYAMTIHKAQGKTLDSAHLIIGNCCFAHGQLYTALSRVRSFDNLSIDRPIQLLETLVDPQVEDFYEDIRF